jgi:hypothetical protein
VTDTATPLPAVYCDFDRYNCRWQWDYSSEGAGTQTTRGQLLFRVSQPDTVRQLLIRGQTLSDYTIEVDVRQSSGTSKSGFGLVFRHLDHENCYRFTLNGQGQFEFGREQNNKWRYFAGYDGPQRSSAVRGVSNWNKLKVVCRGNTLTAYVNGKKVAQATDSSFRRGNVGLLVGTEEEGNRVDVLFDNLVVDTR